MGASPTQDLPPGVSTTDPARSHSRRVWRGRRNSRPLVGVFKIARGRNSLGANDR